MILLCGNREQFLNICKDGTYKGNLFIVQGAFFFTYVETLVFFIKFGFLFSYCLKIAKKNTHNNS